MFLALAALVISGNAWVVDGDSINIGKTHVRLEGIDAPERRQTCLDAKNIDYACGQDSKRALIELTKGQKVECEKQGIDKYGRTLAFCYVGEVDINREQVLNGNAIAYRKYTMRYANDEDEAKRAKRGMWKGTFQQPYDFRHPIK